MSDFAATMNEANRIASARKRFTVLSIDAWNGPEGWFWNSWYKAGSLDELPESNRKILRALRENGILSASSAGKVAIEDDGYNIVILAKGTREPLYAIEYGSQ
jgi:hypothetical protein